MFGKKKTGSQTETKPSVCGECGLNCIDQYNLERHVAWAHPDKKQSAVAGKKD